MGAGGISALRRWALRNLVVADGPRAGRPFRIASPPWGEVLDAMDDATLEQVTIRGSVQSGKTATLIAAGLGHMAAGRSVLIFEPDDKLKRALAARIVAWGRLCKDEAIQEAYEPKRPPFARSTDAGGRLEVISAREGGAAVMRTAQIVIVDELRLFHLDLLGDLVDRMAAYGGKGRLITASSAGYQDECKTTVELEKSDSRRWFLKCSECGQENIASWANVNYKARRYPYYTMPCCGSPLEGVPFRRAVQRRTLEADKGGDGSWHAGLSTWTPLPRRSNPCGPSCASGSGPTRTGSKPGVHGRSHIVPDRAPGAARTSPRRRKA